MINGRVLTGGLAIAALMACQDLPVEGGNGPMACNAEAHADLVGRDKSAIASAGIPEPLRIIPPGTLVTRDYRLERTNVDLNDHGTIVRIWCG